MTFSKSVAEHVNALVGDEYTLQRFRIHRGRVLRPGEESQSGLYGIEAVRKEYMLRVSLCRETANLLCDFDSRRLVEVFLTRCK